jgi:hypothetical protein
MVSLDKVLRLSQPAAPAPDASALVRTAADDLERLAALLLASAGDDDGEGDDDEEEDDGDESKGDEDDDTAKSKKGAKGKAGSNNWSKGKGDTPAKGKGDDSAKGGKKMPPWLNKGKKDDKVKASRELVESAMTALSQLSGGEHLIVALGHSPAPGPAQTVIRLARGGPDVAMEHGPMSGEHDHPHRVANVHSHKHTHNGDSRHACGDPGYGAY